MSLGINPKVSVILPVYNAGEYLRKCIDSLVNQTLKEIELIIIVDCPSDGSDIIVNEYASQYPQIKVIKNSKNLHIGNSRNKGLEIAKGEYIGFCDHDDYCIPEMFEILYNKAKDENLDIVISPHVGIKNNIRINEFSDFPEIEMEERINLHISAAIGNLIAQPKVFSFPTLWNRLFRRNIILENQIKFLDTRYNKHEDNDFIIRFLAYAKTCGYIKKDLYFHVYGINNTSYQETYSNIKNFTNYASQLYNFLNNNNLYNDVNRQQLDSIVQFIIIVYILESIKKSKGLSKFFLNIKYCRHNQFIRQSFKKIAPIHFYKKKFPKNLIYLLIRNIIII